MGRYSTGPGWWGRTVGAPLVKETHTDPGHVRGGGGASLRANGVKDDVKETTCFSVSTASSAAIKGD